MILAILIFIAIGMLLLGAIIYDWMEFFAFGFAIDFIILFVVVAITLINQFGAKGIEAELIQKYEALKYKIENESYRDEIGLRDKEVIDEIQAWNEDISYKKTVQKDFWIGVLYPNIYDQFETIDYNINP